MTKRNSADQQLRERARAVIPNGMYGHMSTRLLPDDYPQFFSRAKGAHMWDADGTEYIDYLCAYGPNLLGYADEEIDRAYIEQLRIADTLTGPTHLMVELAEQLTQMVSHAAWAMFCKNGADSTQMAIMAAREHTQRKVILIAKGSYHGSFPWAASRTNGVTPEDKANQIYYEYNNIESLDAAAKAAGGDLAAILATPYKHDAFKDQALVDAAYARRAREICDQTGALLVVDDVRAGLRISRDCSWSLVGVQPDLSCWGKCIANGHPISALLGSEKVREAAGRIYVTGSYWLQSAPMAAALKTLKRVRETDYLEHITRLGDRLREGLTERAGAAGLGFRQTGPSTMPLFLFEDDADMRQGFYWSSQMLQRGVYVHPWHNMFVCAATTDADITQTLDAAEASFSALKAVAHKLAPLEKMNFLVPVKPAA